MKIVYISKGKMFLCNDGKVSELPCERAAKYADTVNEVNRNKHSRVDYEYQEEESGRKLLLTAMKDFFFAIDLPSAGGYLKMILDLLNESQEYFQDLLSDYNIGFINQQRDKISPYQA